MKTFVLMFLLSASAFAQSNSSNLINKLTTIPLGGNGSECSLSKYDVKKFDYNKVAKAYFAENAKEGELVLIKWADVTEVAKYYSNKEWMNIFNKLQAAKEVKAMFGTTPDSDVCTESEYCQKGDISVYFNNGQLLTCWFDWTT